MTHMGKVIAAAKRFKARRGHKKGPAEAGQGGIVPKSGMRRVRSPPGLLDQEAGCAVYPAPDSMAAKIEAEQQVSRPNRKPRPPVTGGRGFYLGRL